MELSHMSKQALAKWVRTLEQSLADDPDEKNAFIYKKWLEEAKAEQDARYSRRYNYLKMVGKL